MRRRWLALTILGLAAAEAVAGAGDLSSEWREIARRLSAEDFADRQSAERLMATQPSAAALPWLSDLARAGDDECSLRALRVLAAWVAHAPLELADQAEQQLVVLTQAPRPDLARRASDALAVHQELRSQRAAAALQAMGAKIDYGPDRATMLEQYNVAHEFVDFAFRNAQIDDLVEGPARSSYYSRPTSGDRQRRELLPRRPAQVYFPPGWTGGDAGVAQLRRLVALDDAEPFGVFVIQGSEVSTLAVQRASSEIENAVPPQVRGPCLGVGQTVHAFSDDRLIIGEVLPGGAADDAGVMPGDEVLSIGWLPVKNFEDLVNSVAAHLPGDRVEVTFYRGWFTHTVDVTLGDWTDVDTETKLWTRSDPFRIPPRRIFIPRFGPK
jgi:hypothetical protein